MIARTKRQEILEEIDRQGLEEVVLFDGLDDCIIGFCCQHTGPTLIAYSVADILKNLQSQGMDEEGAMEFFAANIECLYAGKGTPVLVYDFA